MTAAFKFRYVNEIVGGFVIVVLLLVVAAVILAGSAQRWFEPVYELHSTFPPEGTFGLQKGAGVEILGTTVGTVDRIRVADDGRLQAVMKIRGEFIRFVRTDSTAVVKKKFGVADAYVVVSVGRAAELPAGDAFELPIRQDSEIVEMVEDVVEQVRAAVLPAIEELARLLAEARELARDLRQPEGALQQSLASIRDVLGGIERGEGTVGKILRDPSMAEDVKGLLKELGATMGQVQDALRQTQGILEDVKKTTAQLPAMADTVKGELDDVPGLVLQTQATLRETERLLVGLERHWLLRSYVDAPAPIDPIPLDASAPAVGVPR